MAKIYLSPSTQEWNQYVGGGTGTGDSEEYWMRKIAFPLADLLRQAGHAVRVGGTVSWQANVADSNAWGSHYHYAFHTNAGGGHGTEVWYHANSTVGKSMAEKLYPPVAAESNEPDRGIRASVKYGELNNTKMPAVIVELLFHDCQQEAQEMRNDWQKFVVAIAKGILAKVGGSLPVPVEYLETRAHIAKVDKGKYKSLADSLGDTIRFYPTPKDSWKTWGAGV